MGKLNPSCKQSLPPTTIPCLSVSKILILPRGNQTLRDLLPPPSQLHSWSPSPNQSFLLTSLYLQPQFYKPRTWTMRQPLTGFQPFSLSLSLWPIAGPELRDSKAAKAPLWSQPIPHAHCDAGVDSHPSAKSCPITPRAPVTAAIYYAPEPDPLNTLFYQSSYNSVR